MTTFSSGGQNTPSQSRNPLLQPRTSSWAHVDHTCVSAFDGVEFRSIEPQSFAVMDRASDLSTEIFRSIGGVKYRSSRTWNNKSCRVITGERQMKSSSTLSFESASGVPFCFLVYLIWRSTDSVVPPVDLAENWRAFSIKRQ